MADRNDKSPRNVEGKFYVDMTCIDCDLCRTIAPDMISRDTENTISFFHRQPTNNQEADLAEEAVEACPTESIGNDG